MPFAGKYLKSYMEFQYENMSNDNKPFAVVQNFFQTSFKQKKYENIRVCYCQEKVEPAAKSSYT
jgi:hypothetical protein